MVSIVIPNYNGVHHLNVCFESLRAQTYKEFKVILVDNNSSDDSINFTKENFPEVFILRLDSNMGFAGAVNAGIKKSLNDEDVTHILLLNNDIECTPQFLEELMKGFKSKDTGSVAGKMLNYFNRNIIDNAGDFIKRRGVPYGRGSGEVDHGQFNNEEHIWGACAGAALYRKEIFDVVGLFDEDFFAYFEDVDFNFRMQLLGYKCFYNPNAICFHKRGSTFKDNSGLVTMYCEKNLVAVRLKNYPSKILFKWFPFFILGRIRRFYNLLIKHSPRVFLYALKGFLRGLAEAPKSLAKRKDIQRRKRVSTEYIESIFR